MKYVAELDGLRFVCFLAVYVHHTVPRSAPGFVSTISAAGAFGVDVFFVLSGFLITSILLEEKRKFGGISVGQFYWRRVLRIWPLYLLMIGLAVVGAQVSPSQNFSGLHALAFLFFAGNWLFVVPNAIQSYANPLWSVSIEEQFYLVWPWVIAKCDPVRAAIAMLLLANLCRVCLVFFAPSVGVWNNTVARVDTLALGILLACLGWKVASVGVGAALLLLAGALPMTEFPLHWSNIVGYPIVAIGAVLLVAGAPKCRFLSNPILVYLGKISFGLYVYHKFALFLLRSAYFETHRSPTQLVVYWFMGLGLTILIAAVSYRWLELPFLRLKHAGNPFVGLSPRVR